MRSGVCSERGGATSVCQTEVASRSEPSRQSGGKDCRKDETTPARLRGPGWLRYKHARAGGHWRAHHGFPVGRLRRADGQSGRCKKATPPKGRPAGCVRTAATTGRGPCLDEHEPHRPVPRSWLRKLVPGPEEPRQRDGGGGEPDDHPDGQDPRRGSQRHQDDARDDDGQPDVPHSEGPDSHPPGPLYCSPGGSSKQGIVPRLRAPTPGEVNSHSARRGGRQYHSVTAPWPMAIARTDLRSWSRDGVPPCDRFRVGVTDNGILRIRSQIVGRTFQQPHAFAQVTSLDQSFGTHGTGSGRSFIRWLPAVPRPGAVREFPSGGTSGTRCARCGARQSTPSWDGPAARPTPQ